MFHEVSQQMYAQQGAAQQAQDATETQADTAPADDIVDADFEEKDKE